MAYLDYILCGRCHQKLIYDGDGTSRDWLLERFGEDSLICPNCFNLERSTFINTMLSQVARLNKKYSNLQDEDLILIHKLRKEVEKLQSKKQKTPPKIGSHTLKGWRVL